MEGTEHKTFSRTGKALVFLPLLALAAGIFWHITRHAPEDPSSREPSAGLPARQPVSAQPAETAEQERTRYLSALNIQGKPEFKSQVTGALKLIWMADRDTFLFIKRYIFIIRNEDKTEFYLDADQPVAALSDAQAYRSMPWCAGIIAHQAYHSYAKFTAKKKKGFTPPPPGTQKNIRVDANPMIFEVNTRASVLETESKASAFQLKILAETGASGAEKSRVKNRGMRDFTTGHDGAYSLNP